MCNCGKANTNIMYSPAPVQPKVNTPCTTVISEVNIALQKALTKPRSVKLNILLGKIQSMINLGEYCRYDIDQINIELDAL